jgi:hypothetical protein
MAVETSIDAYLPVTIVLFKLHVEQFFERLFSGSKPAATATTTTTTAATMAKPTQANPSAAIDVDTLWDLYLMAALLGLIGALFTLRRQRVAFRR